MSPVSAELRVVTSRDRCMLSGSGSFVELVNEFLGYLSDRNYSRQTVRAYAFDLLHFVRWLSAEQLELDAIDTDALLRYMAACRASILPHQAGGNVYSIRDGRNTGYAPRTINRRLAALSALFTFRGLRDPAAVNPIPRGREARQTARGERAGLLGHLPNRRHAPR
jgi:site-specific recombinase XerD